jgi:hypothetical protein
MSTLEEVNEAVAFGLYNNFTRYGKMTMRPYHNEEFINLKISTATESFLNKGAVKLYFVLCSQDSSQNFSYGLIYMQSVGFSRCKRSTIF